MIKDISGFKPFLIYSVVLVAVAFAGAYGFNWWQNRSAGDSKIVEQTTESGDIKEFSMGGEVLAIDKVKSELTFKTGWVQKTANGNEFVYTNRTVSIVGQTKIFSITEEGTFAVANEKLLDYFRVGDKITVYGSGNPISATTLLADKIEIQR